MLPANATLTSGTGTFNVTLKTAGSQTLTVKDATNATVAGGSGAVTVSASAATHYWLNTFASAVVVQSGAVQSGIQGATSLLKTGSGTATDSVANSFTGGVYVEDGGLIVTIPSALPDGESLTVGSGAAFGAPASTTAGTAFTLAVIAQDAYNNTATGYAGTLHFTSSDAAAVLPANATLTNGVGTFSVTLKTAGSQTLSATDTVTGSLAASGAVNVSPAAASHFLVSAPASAAPGTAFNFTVTAQDAYNNTTTAYAGTVHFTSSDLAAVLPANAALTGGAGTFSATLTTGGSQTISATDTVSSSITGASGAVNVLTPATHFSVSVPATATAGVAFNVRVTALDANNNTAAGYSGTVHFTSSDSGAVLPANATLTNGTATFSATLNTVGNQTVTATDTASGTLNGTSTAVNVSAATGATHFVVIATRAATAGSSFNFTVTAQDANNNTDTSYSGTVQITSSDAAAALPANATLVNGSHTFSITLKTAGNQTITATDTVNSSLTGVSGAVTVAPASARTFSLSTPANTVTGASFTFTVTAKDLYNNTATLYSGTVRFSTSDPSGSVPSSTSLNNGTGTFSATLRSLGSQTLTATDTVSGSLSGTSNGVNVTASAPVVPGASLAASPAFVASAAAFASPASGGPAPSVTLQTPGSVVSGNGLLNYSLADTLQDPCNIIVQFSPDGGATWQDATMVAGGDGVSNLSSSSSSSGFAHHFLWASELDIGIVHNPNVLLSVTPIDALTGAIGATVVTGTFSVNNQQLPVLSIDGAPSSIVAGQSFFFRYR